LSTSLEVHLKNSSLVVAVAAASWASGALAAPGIPGRATNPAASQFALDGSERLRLGILSSMAFSTEVGAVDNFSEEIEQLIDELDRDAIPVSEGTELVDHFNALLPDIGRDGYAKLAGSVELPLFPLVFRTGHGVYTVDASLAAQGRLSILDAPLTFNPLSEELETPTAAYVKGAQVTDVAVGFSRMLWKREARSVAVGGALRYVRAELSKQTVALESAEDTDEAIDIVRDSYDANALASSAVTADAGVIYDAPHYRVGLTLANLIEPRFEYGAIGTGCATHTGDAQYNCYTAAYFSDRIALEETWTLERRATVDGALLFAGGAGSLVARADLDEVHDPVGDLVQSAGVELAYRTRTNWLPDLRVGYQRNLAGTQLSSANVGATFFDVMHVDVACGLERTDIDGTTVPRTFEFGFGFEMSF
jgi:hypothetical protein